MTEPDAFWAEVRRRLPDADIVLLPPEAPDPPPATADSRLVATIRARQIREAAHATLAAAWSRLATTVPRPATVRRIWRSLEPGPRVVRLEVVARYDGQPDPGVAAVLTAARATVEAGGGTVDEQRWASADGLRLVTDLAEHAVELYGTLDPPGLTATVLSPPLAVPPDLGQDLIAAATEEAPL
jgi:hypothetical protein